MKFIAKLCVPVLSCVLMMSAPAWTASAAELAVVKNAWVRATAPGQKTAGAYMEITASADAAVVSIDTPQAHKAELHMMNMDGGVMRMRAVEKIELPAGKTVKLAPGGLHIMLHDIRQPLAEGGKVALTLTLVGSGGAKSVIKVDAQVRGVGAGTGHHH